MPFIIKTEPFQPDGDEVTVRVRGIRKHSGRSIRPGDEAFVWLNETSGGSGLTWLSNVERVGSETQTVRLVDQSRRRFGNKELRQLKSSSDPTKAGLYIKLRAFAHSGFRELTSDEASFLRSFFGESDSAEKVAAESEVARQKRQGEIASRPDQAQFKLKVRLAYEQRCAVTGCGTAEALEAAHIRIDDEHRVDFNDITNGILLRADIHALFDSGLIALSSAGTEIEVGQTLIDQTYSYLKMTKVFRPNRGAPTRENISYHRRRFEFE